MTVTISRLYDNHNDAQQAVRRLESAGVPHSDISIVANNSDSWFNTDKKVDRDRDGVDDRRRCWKRRRHWCGRRWHCWPSCRARLAGDPRPRTRCRSWLVSSDGGWRGCRSSYRRHLSVRSRRLAFRQKMLTPTPRAFVVEARWCRHEWPIRTGPASTQY
jgi:hypothetical protein